MCLNMSENLRAANRGIKRESDISKLVGEKKERNSKPRWEAPGAARSWPASGHSPGGRAQGHARREAITETKGHG